jgi:hypothetical protein
LRLRHSRLLPRMAVSSSCQLCKVSGKATGTKQQRWHRQLHALPWTGVCSS